MAINDESLLGTSVTIDATAARSALEARMAEATSAATATGEFPAFDSAAVEQSLLQEWVKAGRMGELRTAKGADAFTGALQERIASEQAAWARSQQAWQAESVTDLVPVNLDEMPGAGFGGGGAFGGGGSGNGGFGGGSGGSDWGPDDGNYPERSGWRPGMRGEHWQRQYRDWKERQPVPDIQEAQLVNDDDVIDTTFNVDVEQSWQDRLKSAWGNKAFRTTAGFAAMQFGQEVGSAIAYNNGGEYRTPEEADRSALGALPGAFGIAGAVLGSVVPGIGTVAGGLAGTGVGSVVEGVGGAALERSQYSRESGQELAASLGEAASKAKEFSEQIQASGVATKEFSEALGTAGSVGSFGPNTVPGLTALTNSFGEFSQQNYGAIADVIQRNPMLYQYGQRLASGDINSQDIGSLEMAAADDADFGTLHTLQHAAQQSQLKDNPDYQSAHQRMRAGENPSSNWLGAFAPGANFLANFIPGAIESRGMEGDLPADPMAAQSNDIANTMAKLRGEILQSGTQADVSRNALTLTGLNGSSLGAIESATGQYASDAGEERGYLNDRAAILQKQVDSARNDTDRNYALQKLGEVQQQIGQIDLNVAGSEKSLFATETATTIGEYGVSSSAGQLELTRRLMSGGRISDLQGAENEILGTRRESAQFEINTARSPDSLLTPPERKQMEAGANAELAQIAQEQNAWRFAGVEQNIRGEQIGVQGATLDYQKAGYTGSPTEIFDAAQDAVRKLTSEFDDLTRAIRDTKDVDQQQQLEAQRNAVRGQILGIRHESQTNLDEGVVALSATGAAQSDITGTISRITGGSGASLLDTQQAVADAVAEKRRLDEMAGDTAHYNEQQRADFRRQSEGIDLQNIQRWENQAQYTPDPELANRLINDQGSLYRMGRSFMTPGDMNSVAGSYFQDIGSELSGLNSQEDAQRKAMGGTLPEFLTNQYDSQRNALMNKQVDAANDLANRFAFQLPAITVGGTSFEEAYMPSIADLAGEVEGVAAHSAPNVQQMLQIAGGRNLGFTKSSTFDAYESIFGGLGTAGSDPARSQPGNKTAQALATVPGGGSGTPVGIMPGPSSSVAGLHPSAYPIVPGRDTAYVAHGGGNHASAHVPDSAFLAHGGHNHASLDVPDDDFLAHGGGNHASANIPDSAFLATGGHNHASMDVPDSAFMIDATPLGPSAAGQAPMRVPVYAPVHPAAPSHSHTPPPMMAPGGASSSQDSGSTATITIKLDASALKSGFVEKTVTVPVTNQTAGMGRFMPGAPP